MANFRKSLPEQCSRQDVQCQCSKLMSGQLFFNRSDQRFRFHHAKLDFLPACNDFLEPDDYNKIFDLGEQFKLMECDVAIVATRLDISEPNLPKNITPNILQTVDTNLMAYATCLNFNALEVLNSFNDFLDKKGLFNSPPLKLFADKKDNSGYWRTVARSTHASLANIALKLLQCPCSSAAVERSFSMPKYINSPRRNRLSGQNANNLLF